jgi:aminopeptidase N
MSCRLPTSIVPTHYALTYSQINLSAPYSFHGKVSISLSINGDSGGNYASQKVGNSVTLHCLELNISSATLTNANGVSMDAVSYNFSKTNETCTIVFPSVLPSGSGAVLDIMFEGNLNDQMRGLYRSTYKGLDGEVKTMACTQFEATDARRAFPCWDEVRSAVPFASHPPCNSSPPTCPARHESYLPVDLQHPPNPRL